MRIVLIGEAAFGARVFETLMDEKERIVAVFTPPDRPGARLDPLKEAAVKAGIALFQPETYKDEDIFRSYCDMKPDLTIMAFVTAIIPPKYFNVPGSGAICYHPSILPRHRGASAINWAIISGDTRTGLTIFRPDGGIDTGPVLLQKEVEIGPEDTTGSLYFKQLFPLGVEAIVESVALIKEGRAPSITQDETLATYEPPCDDRVAAIQWDQPGARIYNLVRGCDPQPGAYTYFEGEKIRLYNASLVEEDSNQAPGTISGLNERGIRIALDSGTLLIGKIRSAKTGKVDAFSFATEAGVTQGKRLG